MKKLIIPLLLLLGACSPEESYYNDLPAIVTGIEKAKIGGSCWYTAQNVDKTYGYHETHFLDHIGIYKIGDTVKITK